MVSKKGREWLEGQDPKSIVKREREEELAKQRAMQQAKEDAINSHYKSSVHKVISDLKQGLEKEIPYVRRGMSSEELKAQVTQIGTEANGQQAIVTTLQEGVDTLAQLASEVADGTGSATMREVASQLAAAKESYGEALNALLEAERGADEYLRALGS